MSTTTQIQLPSTPHSPSCVGGEVISTCPGCKGNPPFRNQCPIRNNCTGIVKTPCAWAPNCWLGTIKSGEGKT